MAVFSVRAGVSELVGGFVTEEGVSDGEAILVQKSRRRRPEAFLGEGSHQGPRQERKEERSVPV